MSSGKRSFGSLCRRSGLSPLPGAWAAWAAAATLAATATWAQAQEKSTTREESTTREGPASREAGTGGGLDAFLDSMLSRGPVASARMGDEALANKKYDDAIRFHMEAVSGSKGPDKTDRLLRLSEVAWKALEATPANQTAQKNTRYQLFRNALEEAKRQSPDAIEPRRRLAEFYFNAIRVLPAVDRPYVQFLEEADGILKIDPADHLTLFRRGIVYAMRSDVDAQTYGEKALADFRKAIELKKDSAEYWSQYLAYLQFLRTKDRAAAEDVIKAYEQAIQANPKNPDFYVGLGGFKYRMMPAEGASRETARKDVLGLFQKAIAAAPESATGYLAVAEVLINEGVACDRKGEKKQAAALYEKAMAVLVDARRKTGELHRVCHMQALVYERQGLFAKGIEAYREAIRELQGATDTRPGSPTPSPEMVKAMTGELYYRLGHALLNDAGRKEEKDRQPSIDEARQCLVAMRERTADEASVNLEARLLLGEKRLDEAYRVLQAAYDKNPSVLTFPNTLLLAELCVSKNIPTKAEAILKALVPPADTESTVQVLVLKAKCRSMLGDTAGASANVEEALRLDPGNKLAKALQTQLGTGQDRQKALAKWQAGQREEAIRDMERLVRRKNDDTQAIRDLAAMYDAAGRRTELLALLEDALKRLPDDRNIIFTRAVYSEADPARRKEAYLKSLHEIADPFERDVQLAQFYAMSEDFEQALVHLERAHGTKPNDKAVVGQLFIAELRRNNFDAARKWAMQLKALDAVAGQTALGDLAMTLRDPDTAIEAYSKVLATNKDAKEVFVNRGRCYARKRKYDLAEKDFQAAWDLDNRYLDAAVGLAQVAAMKKDQPALDKWVKTAIEMPGGIRVKWVRDQALASAEKRRESLQSLIQKREQIVAVDGDDEDNRLALGSLYMRSGETSKAEEQFTFVYGHSKNGAVLAAGRLAELYQNTRRPDKAKGILNDLQTKTDDRQGAMLTYADYLLRAEGPTPDCRKMIEAAIQLNEKDPRGYAEMARLHEAAERWDKAAALWEKVMVLGVRDIPVLSEEEVQASLIEATIRTRQFDKAKKAIDAMLARDADDPQAALLLNMWYQEQGQTDKAKAVLAAAIRTHEDVATLYRARGGLCMRLGDLQEAQADLAKAKKLDPSDPLVGMALARAYERSRLPDRARAEYVGVISQNPSYRPAYDRLMTIYTNEQDWAKLGPLLEQARAIFPDDPSLLMQEGQMWLARREPEKGLARMKQASDLPRGNSLAALGAYLANLAALGRFEEMVTSTEALAAAPTPPAWLLAARAEALVKRNQRPADAEALFLRAAKTMTFGEGAYIVKRAREAYGDDLAIDKVMAWGRAVPKNWEWQLEVGLLARAGVARTPPGPERDAKVKQAVAELIKARDLVEDSNAGLKADIDFNIGTFLQLQNKPRDAEQAYLRVLKTNPRHMLANNNLAVLYCDDLDQPAKALACAETVVKYHDVDANALDTYGWALARAGQLDKALSVLTRAKIQDPDSPDARYHRGWTLEQLKRLPEARTEYQRGADLVGPDQANPLYDLLQKGLTRTR